MKHQDFLTLNIKKFLIFFILLKGHLLMAQGGKTLENQILKSDVLQQPVYYNIYLPRNYNKSKEYPVIFSLHGFGGNHKSSAHYIKVVDSLIAKNEFPETIIIAPDGKKTWYLDDYAGAHKYSSMFIHELVPQLKKLYAITNDGLKTAITGVSMGGFGALRFSMLYPNQFGICVSFMAGISTKDQIAQDTEDDYNTYHQKLYGENLKPFERANEFFLKNNPLYIVAHSNLESLQKLKLFIQTCDDDYHSLPNAELHVALHKRNVKHEFRVENGGHNRSCVNSSLLESLTFIREQFQR